MENLKTQEKNKILPKFLSKQKSFDGVPLFMPFLLTNIFKVYQFHTVFTKNIIFFSKKLAKI